MRIISTTLLGFVDYLTGITLMLPYIMNLYPASADTGVLACIGFFIFLNAAHTDYSFSPIKIIPVRLHLLLNVIADLAMIVSPFVILFEHYRIWLFLVVIMHLLATLLTDPDMNHAKAGRKWL